MAAVTRSPVVCRRIRGREYTEPPVAMIVDAILGHVYGGAPGRAAPGQEA